MTLVLICNAALWFAVGFLLYDWYYRPMPDRIIRKFRTLKRVIKVWTFRDPESDDGERIDRWLYERRGEIDQTDPCHTARMLLNDFSSIQSVEVMDGSMTRGCIMRR